MAKSRRKKDEVSLEQEKLLQYSLVVIFFVALLTMFIIIYAVNKGM